MRRKRLLSLMTLVIMLMTSIVPPVNGFSFAESYSSDLIISEYIEGSSNNKAIEIFNGTGSSVDMSEYSIELYSNGGTSPGKQLTMSGTLENGDVYVIANPSAGDDIKNIADVESEVTYYNGDDALVLKHNSEVIDSLGRVGEDPGSSWDGATKDKTMVRKASVTAGDTVIDNEFDPSLEWDVYDQDTFSYLGSHTMEASSYSSIATARKTEEGKEITVRGTVTSADDDYYIQDDTAGIALYSGSMSGLDEGDYIEVTGSVDEYNGLRQIKNFEATKIYDATSSGAIVISPAAITIDMIGEDYESELVELEAVRIGEIKSTGTTYLSDPMGQSIGSYKMPVPSDIEEGDLVDVTAIVSQYNSYQLYVRSSNDVTSSSAIYVEIEDTRLLDDGVTATVRGVITANDNKTFVQDSSGAVNLYKQSNEVEFDLGDLVEITGKTGAYNGVAQLADYNVELIKESYGEVTPQTLTIEEILSNHEDYESEVVKIDNITIGEINTSGSTTLTDESDKTISVYKIPSLTGIKEGDKVSVTAFVSEFRGSPQLHIESSADVNLYTGYDTEFISTAREKADDVEVTVLGTVVYRESGTLMYIQDGSAGIKVDTYGKDVDLSGYNAGDLLVVTGLIDTYKVEKEISVENSANIITLSTGNALPEPTVITASQLADYQGQLVALKEVRSTAEADDYNIYISDDSGECAVYHAKASNFDKSTVSVNDYYDIIGVAATYNSPQLKLRDGADIVEIEGPVDPNAVLPLIFNKAPAHLSEVFDNTPSISAKIEKTVADIDESTIKMFLDGSVVAHTYAEGIVSYDVESALELGEHKVEIEVSDIDGAKASEVWYFNVDEEDAEYNFYYGVPHSHTAYSDGKLTPTDAFEYAQSMGLDFLITTDHSNWFDGVKDDNYEYNAVTDEYDEIEGSEWYKTRIEAEAFNEANDDFLAVRGFEMTYSKLGHLNMVNSDTYVEAKSQMPTLDGFYDWVNEHEEGVAAFNHPNWPSDSFNNLAYVPEMDRMISVIEVGNGAPPYSYARSEEWYIRALDNGWRVGAINGQDNHSNNWGEPDNLTVVVAEELTTESFVEAYRQRSTYSSETRTLELTFKGNGHMMGSVVNVEPGDEIDFEVVAKDSEVKIVELQLISNGGTMIDSYTPSSPSNSVTWNPSVTVNGGNEWYFVKVIHETNEWGTSSPIFTPEAEENVKIATLEFDPATTLENMETGINVTLSNTGVRDVADLEVKLYKNSVSEANLIDTMSVSALKAGKTEELEFTWTPDEAGEMKIIAKMTEIPGVTTVTELSATLKVVNANGKTVMIDDAHENADVIGAVGNIMSLLRRYGYNVIVNEETITEELLSDVDVLIINNPENDSTDLTADEEAAVAAWVNAGGGLLTSAKSNYGSSDSTQMNSLLEAVGTNIRFNDDGVYEPAGSEFMSGGMQWSVYSYNLPEMPSGLNDYMEAIRIFSGCSLANADGGALVNDPETGLEIILGGNASSYNTSPGPNAHVYNVEGELNGEAIPFIAKEEVGEGHIIAAGRHFYSDFEIINDVSNTSLTITLIDYLADYDRIMTMREVRENAKDGDLVTVKGTVTAPNETFYDVIYIQDETSGICLYGSYQDKKDLPVGTEVIASGVVKYFEGELELAYDDFDTEILYVGYAGELAPMERTNYEAMDEFYTGGYLETSGWIVEMNSTDSYFVIYDGTGLANIHVDGYVADIDAYNELDYVVVRGIASVGSIGNRIRVRGPEDIEVLHFEDTEAPEIVEVSPENGVWTYSTRPTIRVKVEDNYVVNPSSIVMKIDGSVVNTVYKNGYCKAVLDSSLSLGNHVVEFYVEDYSGNSVEDSWRFLVKKEKKDKDNNSSGNSSSTTKEEKEEIKEEEKAVKQEIKALEKADAKVSKSEDGRVKVEVVMKADELLEDIKKNNTKKLEINAIVDEDATNSEVQIDVKVFKEATVVQKDIEIKTNQANIIIPPKAFAMGNDQTIEVSSDTVDEAETQEIMAKTERPEVKLASSIIELDIFTVSGSNKEKAKLTEKVEVELSYDKSVIKDPRKAAVYYFNEEDGEWEYVGGYMTADGKIKVALSHFSKYAVMEYDKTYSDIQGHWAQEAIEIMSAKHIVSGVSEDAFDPSREISRAEFVTMLLNAIDLESMSVKAPMADVAEDAWYYDYMLTAAQYGLVKADDGLYNPNEVICRDEMARILAKASQLVAFDMTATNGTCNFTDIASVDTETAEAIQTVYDLGLMSGTGSDQFSPEGNSKRCEAAMVIYKLVEHEQKSVLLAELAE